jgi:TetR/AcrR family tetracycline transcriptional repressor
MARKEQLSQERILAVARRLVEEEGLDALSMRRLGQELDVWPMSVYRYFRDKEELLDAVAASAAEDFELPTRRGSWRTQMTQLLSGARARLAADPAGLASRLPRTFFEPGGQRLSEAAMAILVGAGFSEHDAASAWRALWSYTFGFATSRADSPRAARAAIAALPEDSYPALAAAGDSLADALASDYEFGAGLDRLLDGLEARAASA